MPKTQSTLPARPDAVHGEGDGSTKSATDTLVSLSSSLEADVQATIARLNSRRDPERVWRGLSGEVITGREVIDHLVGVIAMLTEHGWVSDHHDLPEEESPLDGVSETSTLKAMVHALIAFVKGTQSGQPGPYTLFGAADRLGDSDSDTVHVARRIMECVLAARVDAFAVLWAWEERRGRTLDEVRELAAVAAEVARRVGPCPGDGAR